MSPAHEPASARSTIFVWACLIGLTLVSFALFEIEGAGGMRRAAIAIIMALAGMKACLVFRYFMGLGDTPRSYRLIFLGWTVFCAALITISGIVALR